MNGISKTTCSHCRISLSKCEVKIKIQYLSRKKGFGLCKYKELYLFSSKYFFLPSFFPFLSFPSLSSLLSFLAASTIYEVLGTGIKSKPQLCSIPQLQQHWVLNLLSGARASNLHCCGDHAGSLTSYTAVGTPR